MYGQAGWGFAPAPTAPQGGELSRDDLMKGIPEYRKRLRRAKALRSRRDKLQEMEDKEISLGGVSQTSDGGLYQTQGTYIPNYSGMAQKAVGALGGAFADRKGGPLEEAEEELDEDQTGNLLRTARAIAKERKRKAKLGY